MNVTFVINSKKALRDLYLSGFMNRLHDFELNLVTQDEEVVVSAQSLLGHPVQKIKDFLPVTEKIANFFALCRLWRYKERSRSHFVRAISLYGTQKQRKLIGKPLNNGLEQSAPALLSYLVRLLSLRPFFDFVKYAFNLLIAIEVLRFSKCCKTDLLIIPYSGELSGQYDLLVSLSQKNGASVVSFQSSWDNLSSKNFIHCQPDFFGVWGEQSFSHLRAIQHVTKSKAVILGNPRQLEIGESEFGLDLQKTNIIFAGDGIGLQDILILNLLTEFSSPSIEIIYRPHPFVRNPIPKEILEKSFGNKLKLIEEDSPDKNVIFLAELRRAKLIVSQLSTLCVEALMMKIPVCVPLFSEEFQQFGYKEAFDQLNHFIGLRLVPELFPVFSPEQLRSSVGFLLTQEFNFNTNLEWICSKQNFSDALLRLLEEIRSGK